MTECLLWSVTYTTLMPCHLCITHWHCYWLANTIIQAVLLTGQFIADVDCLLGFPAVYWIFHVTSVFKELPSVLWHCWLVGMKGIRPVKNWVVGCWHGYLSGARCKLADAQLMPLPLTVSCSSKIQIGFTFLVPAYPGCPGKEAC